METELRKEVRRIWGGRTIFHFLLTLGWCAILIIGLPPSNLIAETVGLQPGPGLNDGTDDGSANAGKDTGFTEPQPWGRNDGAGETLQIFNSDCNIGLYPGFLEFSLANMPTQNIGKAEIQIYSRVYFNGAGWPWPVGTYQISLRKITSAWNEIEASLGNQPSYDPGIIDFQTFNTAGGSGSPFIEFQDWLTFDITNLYKGWADKSISNHGVVFHLDTPFCTNGDVISIFSSDYSADSSLRPKLVVTTLTSIYNYLPLILRQ